MCPGDPVFGELVKKKYVSKTLSLGTDDVENLTFLILRK